MNENKKPSEGEQILRLIVVGGKGCQGFQYDLSLVDSVGPDDLVFQKNGSKVVVDSMSLGLVKGCTIDFKEEMVRTFLFCLLLVSSFLCFDSCPSPLRGHISLTFFNKHISLTHPSLSSTHISLPLSLQLIPNSNRLALAFGFPAIQTRSRIVHVDHPFQ